MFHCFPNHCCHFQITLRGKISPGSPETSVAPLSVELSPHPCAPFRQQIIIPSKLILARDVSGFSPGGHRLEYSEHHVLVVKTLPGKVRNISSSSFPCKGLQSETNHYPGLQGSSSPLQRDVEKHSTPTKTPGKESPRAGFWLGSDVGRFPFLPCA